MSFNHNTSIAKWREFRDSLDDSLEDHDHLRLTAEYWSKVKLVTFYVDWDNPKNWPTPWEILSENQFCPSGVAIMMYHTLLYAHDRRWDNRLELVLAKDRTYGISLMVLADKKWLLNFDLGIVAEVSSSPIEVMQRYHLEGGKYREVD